MQTKIYSVDDVQLAILKTFPPTLRIVATGLVTTGGWSDPQLVPYVYVSPPADGIYDFDFIARPPAGIAIQVILPITAAYHWRGYPQELIGVRIHASSGSLEEMLNAPREIDFKKVLRPEAELRVPLFLTGIVEDEGIGYCRDGATHRLLYINDCGFQSSLRLKAQNGEAGNVLRQVSGSRQSVSVAGYLRTGIEHGCEYLSTYYAGPEIQPESFAAFAQR